MMISPFHVFFLQEERISRFSVHCVIVLKDFTKKIRYSNGYIGRIGSIRSKHGIFLWSQTGRIWKQSTGNTKIQLFNILLQYTMAHFSQNISFIDVSLTCTGKLLSKNQSKLTEKCLMLKQVDIRSKPNFYNNFAITTSKL